MGKEKGGKAGGNRLLEWDWGGVGPPTQCQVVVEEVKGCFEGPFRGLTRLLSAALFLASLILERGRALLWPLQGVLRALQAVNSSLFLCVLLPLSLVVKTKDFVGSDHPNWFLLCTMTS